MTDGMNESVNLKRPIVESNVNNCGFKDELYSLDIASNSQLGDKRKGIHIKSINLSLHRIIIN